MQGSEVSPSVPCTNVKQWHSHTTHANGNMGEGIRKTSSEARGQEYGHMQERASASASEMEAPHASCMHTFARR
eukprot:1541727-Alexandrium_andersonii.AAC.1